MYLEDEDENEEKEEDLQAATGTGEFLGFSPELRVKSVPLLSHRQKRGWGVWLASLPE
jgi:hypothetical protein